MDQDNKVNEDIDVVDIDKDNSSEPIGTSNHQNVDMEENESDSDFGNFSDASIEIDNPNEDKDDDDDITIQLDRCFNLLFNQKYNFTSNNSEEEEDGNVTGRLPLEDLIKEERPHVIYDQLFSGRLHTQPFNWKRSYIRSTSLHILGIEQESEHVKKTKKQEPLDDSLYVKLCNLLESDAKGVHYNTMILKDYFNFIYSPRFIVPGNDNEIKEDEERDRKDGDQNNNVQSTNDDENELETQIPKLLNQDSKTFEIEKMTNEELQKYHDKLCNAIDLLMIKLKGLNKLQTDLIQDKIIFENVVTNLSGHTQRLQRDEIELYNKKFGNKSLSNQRNKRFSWVGL